MCCERRPQTKRIAVISRVLAAVSVLAVAAAAYAGNQPKAFKVYSAVSYKGARNLSPYGIPRADVIYEAQLDDPPAPGSKTRRFSTAKIQKAASAAKRKPSALVVLDMETWGWNKDAMQKYAKAAAEFRRIDPAGQLGMYGFAPSERYLLVRMYRNHNPALRSKWLAKQSLAAPVLKQVDVLLPSLYTDGPDIDTWVKVARTTIAWARKHDPNKPVYAFIWPQYYANSVRKCTAGSKSLQFLPAADWRKELETLYGIADGVVIWSPRTACSVQGELEEVPFRTDMPWFRETLAFMKAHDVQ